MFAHIVSPARSTSRASGRTKGNGILTAQHTYSFKRVVAMTLPVNFVILMNDAAHVLDKFLHLLLEVG